MSKDKSQDVAVMDIEEEDDDFEPEGKGNGQATLSTGLVMAVHLKGVTPALHHNPLHLVDPLSAPAIALKKISSKRIKTEEDHMAMAKIEMEAGLYVNSKGALCVPCYMLKACIRDGAKKFKKGKEIVALTSIDDDPDPPLIFKGPKTFDGLWKQRGKFMDRQSVKVQQARVMRTRAIFTEWAVKFHITFRDINEEDIRTALNFASTYCGLFDYRSEYGHFEVVSADVL